ncbi:MAG: type IV pilus assembly protein PilM [Minisyncoccia bacterium]
MDLKQQAGKFFNNIKNFLSSGRIIGLDIGTSSIKAVELTRIKGKLILTNYGILNTKQYLVLPNAAIQTPSLKIVDKNLISLLKILLKETKFKAKNVVVSLPVFTSFSAPILMPLMSIEETVKAIPYQAKKFVPMPLDQVMIDWIKIGETEDARGNRFQHILLIATPKSLVNFYRNVLKQVNLNLFSLEVENIAAVRAVSSSNDQPTLIIDIGAEVTSLSIESNGIIEYATEADYGGAFLTKAVSKSLDINPYRAEELKIRNGLYGQGGESILSNSIMPFLDIIIQEAFRVMNIYSKTYGKDVTKVILIGGGAKLLGINEYFNKQLNLPVYDPLIFKKVKYPSILEPLIKDLDKELAIAVGLVLKYY